jgi:hypothetical protein
VKRTGISEWTSQAVTASVSITVLRMMRNLSQVPVDVASVTLTGQVTDRLTALFVSQVILRSKDVKPVKLASALAARETVDVISTDSGKTGEHVTVTLPLELKPKSAEMGLIMTVMARPIRKMKIAGNVSLVKITRLPVIAVSKVFALMAGKDAPVAPKALIVEYGVSTANVKLKLIQAHEQRSAITV